MDIEKDLKELEKAIGSRKERNDEVGKALKHIKTQDITKNIEHLLSPKALEALNKPNKQFLKIWENGKPVAQASYMSLVTRHKGVGALRIAKVINDLVENYNVLSILSPPSQLNLPNIDIHVPIATYFFFHLSLEESKLFMENNKYATKEGEIGNQDKETDEEIEEVMNDEVLKKGVV